MKPNRRGKPGGSFRLTSFSIALHVRLKIQCLPMLYLDGGRVVAFHLKLNARPTGSFSLTFSFASPSRSVILTLISPSCSMVYLHRIRMNSSLPCGEIFSTPLSANSTQFRVLFARNAAGGRGVFFRCRETGGQSGPHNTATHARGFRSTC